MEHPQDIALTYFLATKDYFWHWADEGEVVEWTEGQGTICYREELLKDLLTLKDILPPLGPLLLVIAAGRPHWNANDADSEMRGYITRIMDARTDPPTEMDVHAVKDVFTYFFQLLDDIPKKYWKDRHRALLLTTLFESVEAPLPEEEAKEMLGIFQRRAYDYLIAHTTNNDSWPQLQIETKVLVDILQRYPDGATLLKALDHANNHSSLPPAAAGLSTLLGALVRPRTHSALSQVAAGLGEDSPNGDQVQDLLQLLAADEKTAPLALLTQRFIAALHLPMHTKGYSNTLFGGVSDITNKGNFDRLLLSELAHEDETLLVRLANNEALYLRREELEDNEPGKRFILVDKSIKMWGTPHMLSMAAALACAINNKQHAEVLPFVLTGNTCQPVDFSGKEEIIAAMQLLSPALHSAAALAAFNDDHTMQRREEYFLITSEELFHDAPFQHAFAKLRQTDGFLITIARDCTIHLYRYVSGHRKLLRTAKINLDMPKPPARRKVARQLPDKTELPAFMQLQPFPLRLPMQTMRIHSGHNYFIGNSGIAITKWRQLFFWDDKRKGAIEISTDFPDASNYFFGHGREHYYILFQSKKDQHLYLYQLQISTLELTFKEVTNSTQKTIHDAGFESGSFHVTSRYELPLEIHAPSGQSRRGVVITTDDIARMKKAVNQQRGYHSVSYNTVSNIRHLQINTQGNIVVNKHEITFSSFKVVLHKANNPVPARNIIDTEQSLNMPGSKRSLLRYHWPDGSEAWFDGVRHLLHLRSSDTRLPEITIVLVVNEPTACWASDGATCGLPYFKADNDQDISANRFHEIYIKPFINVIQLNGTAAVI